MTKFYTITGSIQEWVTNNSMQLHLDVLESCEQGLINQEKVVDVVHLKTRNGITRFVLNTPSKIIHALNLSLESFVKEEEYELAARARDCIIAWKEKYN
jgi:protein-arginine kinase activator protein McsA